jgi:hypothetical protein
MMLSYKLKINRTYIGDARAACALYGIVHKLIDFDISIEVAHYLFNNILSSGSGKKPSALLDSLLARHITRDDLLNHLSGVVSGEFGYSPDTGDIDIYAETAITRISSKLLRESNQTSWSWLSARL